MPPEPAPDISNAGIQIAPDQIPQLPAKLARHPLVTLVAVVATIISTIMAGIYALPRRDAVDATKLDAVVQQLNEMQEENRTLRRTVSEMSDKLDRQLPDLHERVGRCERKDEAVDRYHQNLDRRLLDYTAHQRETNRRLDALERRR
jgi:hypothetical protein